MKKIWVKIQVVLCRSGSSIVLRRSWTGAMWVRASGGEGRGDIRALAWYGTTGPSVRAPESTELSRVCKLKQVSLIELVGHFVPHFSESLTEQFICGRNLGMLSLSDCFGRECVSHEKRWKCCYTTSLFPWQHDFQKIHVSETRPKVDEENIEADEEINSNGRKACDINRGPVHRLDFGLSERTKEEVLHTLKSLQYKTGALWNSDISIWMDLPQVRPDSDSMGLIF